MVLAVEYPLTSATATGAPGEVFPVGFSFQLDAELVVTFADVAKTAGTHFTISGDRLAGGAILTPTTGNAPAAGVEVEIRRATPKDQPSTFGNSGQLTPAQVALSLDRITRMIQELGRDIGSGGGGGGGGGSLLWADIVGKPSTFPPSTHGHAWGEITSKPAFGALSLLDTINNSHWSGTDLAVANGGTGASDAPGARSNLGLVIGTNVQAWQANLQAIAGAGTPADGKIVKWTSPTTAVFVDIPSGGGGSGMQPRLLSEFGTIDGGGVNTAANDAAITAAEAAADSAIYLPDGVYAKSAATPFGANLTKGYTGRGIWLEGTTALPADFAYMASKPTTWATQGLTGWFRGDQRFTDGGEYKIIGPGARRYDLNSRYFESNTIPHHAWLDVNSGNSGVQAFATSSGFTPAMGTVIPIRAGAAHADWVGKTVGFCTAMDGAPVETRTVTAVNTSGNSITINSALTSTYTWDPASGLTPCILFGKRTWAGQHYMRVTAGADGGGDHYGIIVRTRNFYVPKPSEYHTFMAATSGGVGGDQVAGANGVYMTAMEWAQTGGDAGVYYDVAAIGLVHSQDRRVDTSLSGGRVWMGTYFKSEGTRPVDVGHGLAGSYRYGLNFERAAFIETERLADATISNGSSVKVVGQTRTGIYVGDPVTIGEPGAILYSGTISALAGDADIFSVTPNLPASSIPAGTLVSFPRGGAAMALAPHQRLMFGAIASNSGRGGDPNNVFAAFYGNVGGNWFIEQGTDATSEYLALRRVNRGISATIAQPDETRFRLRADIGSGGTAQLYAPGGVSITGNVGVNGNIGVTTLGQRISLGPNAWIEVGGGVMRATRDNGGTWATII